MGVDQFFNEDGSLNQEAIATTQQRAAQFGGDNTFFADRILQGVDTAVQDQTITQAQADELTAALGL